MDVRAYRFARRVIRREDLLQCRRGDLLHRFQRRFHQRGNIVEAHRVPQKRTDCLLICTVEDGAGCAADRGALTRELQAAERLRAILRAKGYRFFMETPTNQIFVILENGEMKRLGEKVKFSFWEKLDEGHTVVRFATSWATDLNEIEELGKLL